MSKKETKPSKLQFSSEYQNQNFFMDDTNPLNPYGPNYFYLAYDTKVLFLHFFEIIILIKGLQ